MGYRVKLPTKWSNATRLLAVLLMCIGCGSITRPDFERLYSEVPFESRRPTPARDPVPPLIVVPGLLGSRLVDTEQLDEVWPGTFRQIAFGRYRGLRLPVPGGAINTRDVRSTGITETAVGRDFYGRLLHTLEAYGGYRQSELGDRQSDGRHLYVFHYDWRQDNVVTAQAFAAFVEQIRRDHGQPELKVDVIAHSMGGLMVRYFLRYGANDVLNSNDLRVTWEGAASVNKVILLGTPNLGSVSAIEGFVRGYKVGLRRIPPEVVATLPSTFQIFPHRIIDWLYDKSGQVLDVDPFDVETWERFQWNIFDPLVSERVRETHGDAYLDALKRHFRRTVERARRFSWSLTVCPNYDNDLGRCPDKAPEPPVRLVVFGGDCELTPARMVLEQESDIQRLRLRPKEVRSPQANVDYGRLMLDPGDGTVTKPSLLGRDALSPYTPRHEFSYFPLAYSFTLCEHHSTLTGNPNFQDNLLDVLLTRALPGELHRDHEYSRQR